MNNNNKDYKQYAKAVYAGLDRLKTVQLTEQMVKENKMLSVLDKPATYGYAEIANYKDVMEVYENMDVNHDMYGKIKLKEFFDELLYMKCIPLDFNTLKQLNGNGWELKEIDNTINYPINLERNLIMQVFENELTQDIIIGFRIDMSDYGLNLWLPPFFMEVEKCNFNEVAYNVDFLLAKIKFWYEGEDYVATLSGHPLTTGNNCIDVFRKDADNDDLDLTEYEVDLEALSEKEFFEEVKEYINDNMDMLERVNNVNTEYMELDSEVRGQVSIG
ncbi:hypothetical protein B8A44_07460 [Dolosigranulum pigrum]|uniref:Uncharacterized protein n=1 Tax=Dolosigranulum pigrum TaxID=29394 RepID=A0A328KHV9_9LACT|nr:hypothetical protein [Dolosigranulum pigrum]RAN62376.1 hypothetical protein B8A44_07460 [Dolosigranulum pigrum]